MSYPPLNLMDESNDDMFKLEQKLKESQDKEAQLLEQVEVYRLKNEQLEKIREEQERKDTDAARLKEQCECGARGSYITPFGSCGIDCKYKIEHYETCVDHQNAKNYYSDMLNKEKARKY